MVPRERMQDERSGKTYRLGVVGHEPMYLTANRYEDGRVGELWLDGKMGTLEHGWANVAMMAISVGLQHGIPIDVYTDKMRGMKFEPSGLTGNTKIPMVSSLADYVAQVLEEKNVPS